MPAKKGEIVSNKHPIVTKTAITSARYLFSIFLISKTPFAGPLKASPTANNAANIQNIDKLVENAIKEDAIAKIKNEVFIPAKYPFLSIKTPAKSSTTIATTPCVANTLPIIVFESVKDKIIKGYKIIFTAQFNLNGISKIKWYKRYGFEKRYLTPKR